MLMCMFKNICIVHDLQWNIWVFFLNSSPVTASEKNYARSILQQQKNKKEQKKTKNNQSSKSYY